MADRICLGSFSDARIAAARRLFGPAVCTSLGPRGVAALRLSSYSPRAAGLVRIQAGCAQVPLQLGGRALVDERFLAAAHARGLQVHVWTVDDPGRGARDARPRRRRDHDRPAGDAARGPGGARPVGAAVSPLPTRSAPADPR